MGTPQQMSNVKGLAPACESRTIDLGKPFGTSSRGGYQGNRACPAADAMRWQYGSTYNGTSLAWE